MILDAHLAPVSEMMIGELPASSPSKIVVDSRANQSIKPLAKRLQYRTVQRDGSKRMLDAFWPRLHVHPMR